MLKCLKSEHLVYAIWYPFVSVCSLICRMSVFVKKFPLLCLLAVHSKFIELWLYIHGNFHEQERKSKDKEYARNNQKERECFYHNFLICHI